LNEWRDQKFRIDFELMQIDKEVQIVELLKTVMMSGSIDDIQLRAAASTLHSIYNGIEKILLFKVKDQGIKIDTNEKWHTELLLKTM
jgi:hypothetical protein